MDMIGIILLKMLLKSVLRLGENEDALEECAWEKIGPKIFKRLKTSVLVPNLLKNVGTRRQSNFESGGRKHSSRSQDEDGKDGRFHYFLFVCT